ncbi:NmrA-domain-containing protein [Aspergillus sclerotiicarbonarius CBS 121057]|uniref:NmrA-domain-containing protein n=1 Tax=Aspergillus sclerotiicarbonarius (strain CBS 121057 / IBT 28362) TaxID=1448318 RepID=A0A319DXQ2_ASPSB|nr:NmrA-domain-containing protein [Aspergillus sclerotiicarbonarius CBS 121057]
MMSDRKLLVVFGATGIQGGSVAQTILRDPVASGEFKIRAVTRDPSKSAAVSLAQQGAEVVQADLQDKYSLRLALQNAYAVFVITNFWEILDPEAETTQGMNIADVAKELEVKHFIWSSLPYVSRITNNKLTGVVHFDSKARVDDYIHELAIPYTIITVGTYTSFFLEMLTPLPTTPPSYGLFFPEPGSVHTTVPIIDPTADLGKFVKGILLNPEKSLGRSFNIAGRSYAVEEVIAVAKGLDVDIVYHTVDKASFKAGIASKGLPEVVQEDMSQLVQYTQEYGYFGGASLEEGHEVSQSVGRDLDCDALSLFDYPLLDIANDCLSLASTGSLDDSRRIIQEQCSLFITAEGLATYWNVSMLNATPKIFTFMLVFYWLLSSRCMGIPIIENTIGNGPRIYICL